MDAVAISLIITITDDITDLGCVRLPLTRTVYHFTRPHPAQRTATADPSLVSSGHFQFLDFTFTDIDNLIIQLGWRGKIYASFRAIKR